MLGCKSIKHPNYFFVMINKNTSLMPSSKQTKRRYIQVHSNCIANLIDLEGVSIKKVQLANSYIKIFIETKASPHKCPCCGLTTARFTTIETKRSRIYHFNWRTLTLFLKNVATSVPVVKSFMKPIISYHDINNGHVDFLLRLY